MTQIDEKWGLQLVHYMVSCPSGPPWAAPWAAAESLLCLEHLHPSFTDLGICRAAALVYFHSLLCLQLLLCSKFFTSLNLPRCYHHHKMDSALVSGRSVLEPVGTAYNGHGGSFWHLLRQTIPVALCYQNLATQSQDKEIRNSTLGI